MKSISVRRTSMRYIALVIAAHTLMGCAKEELTNGTAPEPATRLVTGQFTKNTVGGASLNYGIYDGCGLLLATVGGNAAGYVLFSTVCSPGSNQAPLNKINNGGCFYLNAGTYFIRATSGVSNRKVARVTLGSLFDWNGYYAPLLNYNANTGVWSSPQPNSADIFTLANQSNLPIPC